MPGTWHGEKSELVEISASPNGEHDVDNRSTLELLVETRMQRGNRGILVGIDRLHNSAAHHPTMH